MHFANFKYAIIHISEMCCFISTVMLLWQPGASNFGDYAGALHYIENSCTQGVTSPLDNPLYFSHIWLGIWISNYGFPEDA